MKKIITFSGALWSCIIAMAMFMTSLSVRAEYVPLTVLSGVDASSGGNEGPASLCDQDTGTKWGCWFDPALPDTAAWPIKPDQSANKCYIIVKAKKAVVPTYYFLVTGNDSKNSGRNWREWRIYGANFASDDLAVPGDIDDPVAAGWTLVDDHTVSDDPLPNDNFAPKNYECSEGVTTAFQYYWIEVLSTEKQAEVYQQMGEFGWGSYSEFQKYLESKPKPDTATDQPVVYYVLSGTKMSGNESLPLLFDGKANTKWGNGFTNRQEGSTDNGAYFIVRASRAILPTYYSLTTANDTQQNPGRNWKQWQIYGLNAESDLEATRDAEGWVALDKKYNVGTDQLPAANYTRVFFELSESNQTAYRYYKVEIDQIVQNGQYMQMAEFNLGDEYTYAMDQQKVLSNAEGKYNPDAIAYKGLLDELNELIESIKTCNDPRTLVTLNASVENKVNEINASINCYAELKTAHNLALNAINAGGLSEDVANFLAAWASEANAVAPDGSEYPVGNYAYILANRQLTSQEALEESRRIYSIVFNNSEPDVAITAKYKFLSGTTDNWQAGESPAQLIDGLSGLNGTASTKWGTGTGQDRFIIFESINAETGQAEPIKPTYYGLVTGGDTSSYPDRNWRNWKIWGANFEKESDATKNSDKWVLLDVKENIGTDILKTTSLFESYIFLSEGCTEPYAYFKIEVYQTGGMQMNEFTFYNTGNLVEYRNGKTEEMADFDPRGSIAYSQYILDYENAYEEMKNTLIAPDVMKFKNQLEEMQSKIEESHNLYMKYDSLYVELNSLGIQSESLSTWWEGYTNEIIAPDNKYIRGSYKYIFGITSDDEETNLGALNDEEIVNEFDYLQWIFNACDDNSPVQYILLGGHTVGQFGDGFYGHLIDGIDKDIYDENSPIDPNTGKHKLLVKGTKWGGNADENGDTYIIFRTLDPTNPFFYTLTTGNDAASYYTRNWGSWYIYGANFEGDAEATKDAAGWVPIDNKENTGQDRLHPVNEEPSYFGFSTETTEEYLYYKVVVTKAYSGTQIQMNELHFGTPEEFEEIKTQYTNDAQDFNYDVHAQKALIDEYVATVPEIDDCANMEALFRVNYHLETLRNAITSSAALYQELMDKVAANKTYIEESNLSASDALTFFQNYLNADETVVPNDEYPNGSPAYLYEQQEANDSILHAELEFMESLRVAAVAAGYPAGLDITCLIVNPTFAKAGEMLQDDKKQNIGREAEGWNGYIYRTANAGGDIFAAEFCNENKLFDVNQTISNLKNGFYKVTLNAGYRANGTRSGTNGQGTDPMLSYNYAAMAYANDIATYIPVVREEAAADSASSWQGSVRDKLIYNYPDSTETFGLGIWGCEGAAHAFEQGRYAITMVAKVTDGTLTIGVKNEGSTNPENALEWTAAGNFGLVYLGAEETDAADALTEAAECNAKRIDVLTTYDAETYDPFGEPDPAYYVPADIYDTDSLYVLYPNFSAVERAALLQYKDVATYEAEKLIGETMKSIYETKKAYINLKQAANKVYDHWFEFTDQKALEDAVYGVLDDLSIGAYDNAEATMQAKAQLYATYPGYLQHVGGSKVELTQTEFTFEITASGRNPYVELANFYEPLEEDQVILAFDYTADQDIEAGKMAYMTPEWDPNPEEKFATMSAASDWTTAYVDISKGIKDRQFGTSPNHGVRWTISTATTADDALNLTARNFRFITMSQMNAEGGKVLNIAKGDIDNSGTVNLTDALLVLDAMAEGSNDPKFDVNGDGKVNLTDFLVVLDIMAEQ